MIQASKIDLSKTNQLLEKLIKGAEKGTIPESALRDIEKMGLENAVKNNKFLKGLADDTIELAK